MSDRAIPRSYRMMEGFGVHTFALVNAEGQRRFVKFHWRPVMVCLRSLARHTLPLEQARTPWTIISHHVSYHSIYIPEGNGSRRTLTTTYSAQRPYMIITHHAHTKVCMRKGQHIRCAIMHLLHSMGFGD